ncbi:MAG: PmoA family protein [Verrucomicrobiota bacterium]
MMMKRTLVLWFAGILAVQAAEFSVVEEEDGIVINIDGKLFTKYVTGDEISNKPYFYPVIGPGGAEMTRAFPMKDVEGERQDHPHHRSLYFGHQFINNFDTWHEQLTMEERSKGDEKKLKSMMEKVGVNNHVKTVSAAADGDSANLKVQSDYAGSGGEPLLADEREFVFHVAEDGSRIIDATIKFIGTEEEVTFSDAKDAGFSVRVAHSISVDAKQGGKIVNSNGDTDKAAWGKRAEWCDYYGPIGDKTLGVAILNHPDSFRHPTPWHVRSYGLFTANPFGIKSVAGEKDKEGKVVLKKGESFTIKHRVIFHQGDTKQAKIAEAYAKYAEE